MLLCLFFALVSFFVSINSVGNISREILFFLLASPNLYFRCPSFFPRNVLRWPQKDTFDKKRLTKNWTEETKDTFPRKPARVQDVLWANGEN